MPVEHEIGLLIARIEPNRKATIQSTRFRRAANSLWSTYQRSVRCVGTAMHEHTVSVASDKQPATQAAKVGSAEEVPVNRR
jgi:hypothetical protein